MPNAPTLPTRRPRSRQRLVRELAFTLRLASHRAVRRRQRPLDAEATAELGRLLVERYFKADHAYLASDEGAEDFWNHLADRLADDRRRVIPWLHRIRPLAGLRVLEIGSGTGSSTVAFAEQGAIVTGIDIDRTSLAIARRRLELHGLDGVRLEAANIADDHPVLAERYDLVVFFASLEHMLHKERLEGLRKAWGMLDPGGHLAVIECPNRLWFFDGHTGWMPFFHWLPDELALDYAALSPRASLARDYAPGHGVSVETFLRHGRGVSFHELRLALGDLDRIAIVGELETFLRRRHPVFLARHLLSLGLPYTALLRRMAPGLHPAFLQPMLNLVLQKPGA